MTPPPARRRLAPTLAVVLALTLNAAAPLSAAAAGRALQIKVGEAEAFSRIELHGARPIAQRREGRDLVLRFARTGAPDMARLHVDPPPHVEKAAVTASASAVELRLTAKPDVDIRTGWADGATFINFAPAAPREEAAAPLASTRPDPVPAGGVVPVSAELAGSTVRLKFPWRAALGAAVFRRGEAVWVVFDAPARLDLSRAPHGLPAVRKVEALAGAGWSAVRVVSPPATPVSASAEGGMWTVTLGPGATAVGERITLDQDLSSGSAALAAFTPGATKVVWLSDPAVGDRIAAVTALAPAKGLREAHSYVGAELLPTAHGLAVRAAADDLEVAIDGDRVRVGRPRGLALSAPGALKRAEAPAPLDLPAPASSPGFVDFAAWSRTGEGGFNARYADLLTRASAETAQGKRASTAARMGLARFLIGSELTLEAVGVLNSLIRSDPTVSVDPEFRGLRGAARAMAGRWADAEADFSTPVTADDAACALWRGYVAWRRGDLAGARSQFAHGRASAAAFAPKWRARFQRADAEAAVAGGDLGVARQVLGAAAETGLAPEEADGLRLASARLAEASGDTAQALELYKAVARSPLGALSAPAQLRAVQIELAEGTIATPAAMAVLDSLRFRWRGDAVELETIRALGHANLEQGRYREALTVLRSAGGRLPNLPQSAELQADLAAAFKLLFLDGQADGLQPIQSLALFYDFKELTPIGTEGDRMVRRLVRRLVDVDLLDQAADLLRYQVDNRLDGVGRAQVATDLAVLQVMARRPEAALQAINGSRTTLLPAPAECAAAAGGGARAAGARPHGARAGGAGRRSLRRGRGGEGARRLARQGLPAAGRLIEARLGDRWNGRPPARPRRQRAAAARRRGL